MPKAQKITQPIIPENFILFFNIHDNIISNKDRINLMKEQIEILEKEETGYNIDIPEIPKEISIQERINKQSDNKIYGYSEKYAQMQQQHYQKFPLYKKIKIISGQFKSLKGRIIEYKDNEYTIETKYASVKCAENEIMIAWF